MTISAREGRGLRAGGEGGGGVQAPSREWPGPGASGRGFRCLGHGTPEGERRLQAQGPGCGRGIQGHLRDAARGDRQGRPASAFRIALQDGRQRRCCRDHAAGSDEAAVAGRGGGPVWAELADALLAADRPAPEVLKAFNEAMAAAGLVSTTTRYRLARQFADGRDPRLAPLSRELFRQIAQQEVVSTTEQEFHERLWSVSRTTSSAQPTSRKQRSGCASNSYCIPPGAEAPLARLLLGVCLIQRSSATLPSRTGRRDSRQTPR